MPCQLAVKYASGLAVPSLMRAKPNRMPAAFTCVQLIAAWYFETSTPWTTAPASAAHTRVSGVDCVQVVPDGESEPHAPRAATTQTTPEHATNAPIAVRMGRLPSIVG